MTTQNTLAQETEIARILISTATETWRIVLQKIRETRNFPQMYFATDKQESYVNSDELGCFSVYATELKPGIPLFRGKEPFISGEVVIALLPDGLFRFPMAKGSIRIVENFPKFSKRTTNDLLWASFGERALTALGPRPVFTRLGRLQQHENRKFAREFAEIGEDFCRVCGTVQPAYILFHENRCQNRECPFRYEWLYESF